MEIKHLLGDKTTISDLVRNNEAVDLWLNKFREYLNDPNIGEDEISLRLRQVRGVIFAMVNHGEGITEKSPKYNPINTFYHEYYGENAPFYVKKDVTFTRKNTQ